MSGSHVFRGARTFVVALLLVASAPAVASAAGAGGLDQLPPPNDCVSSNQTSNCGTVVNGGLGAARSIAVTPDGANAYVASTTGSLSTFGRSTSTGALSFDRCLKDPASTEACPTNSTVPLDGAAWVVVNDGFV